MTEAISAGSASRPSGRPAPTASEHLLTRLNRGGCLLVCQAPVAEPRCGRGRAWRDSIAADAVLGVEIGDETGEREHRRLRDRVVRHPGRRALPRRRRDVHDRAGTRLLHPGQNRPDAADVAHDVQLPHLSPTARRSAPRSRPDRPRRRCSRDTGPVRAPLPSPQPDPRRRPAPRDRTATASSAPTSARAWSARSASRPLTTTRAPSAASRRAVSSPIPAVEPVTRQIRSLRPRSMGWVA